jgi:hypothetical protein
VGNRQEIAEEMKYVNGLIDHRLTWLGTLQGLLFAALGFVWAKPDTNALALIICSLGAAVALSIGLATYGANLVLEELERRIEAADPSALEARESGKKQAPLAWKNRGKWWWWLMPGYFLPWTFLAAWISILLIITIRLGYPGL